MKIAPAHPRNIVGPAVRRVRDRLGWSQERLALQCQLDGWDIDRLTIHRIEAGRRWVGDFELLRLARILGVPFSTLLEQSHAARNRASGRLAGV